MTCFGVRACNENEMQPWGTLSRHQGSAGSARAGQADSARQWRCIIFTSDTKNMTKTGPKTAAGQGTSREKGTGTAEPRNGKW